MTIFEFISVMVSIVLGLSLAHMLAGVSQFARNSKRIDAYLPHSLWLVNLLLLHFLTWWSFWDYRETEWNYARFLIIMLEPLLLFLTTSIAIPRKYDADRIDLRDYFHDVRKWFFISFLVLEAMYILDGPLVFNSEPVWFVYRIPQLIVVAAFVLGLVSRHDRAQLVSALMLNALMLWSSAIRFMPAAFE